MEEPRVSGAVRREVPAGGQRSGSAAPSAAGDRGGEGRARCRTARPCGARGVPCPPAGLRPVVSRAAALRHPGVCAWPERRVERGFTGILEGTLLSYRV